MIKTIQNEMHKCQNPETFKRLAILLAYLRWHRGEFTEAELARHLTLHEHCVN